MPTVLRSGPYRFYFYSHEPNEPPHIHIDREDFSAKFWLELRTIQSTVMDHKEEFLEAWNEFFGIGG